MKRSPESSHRIRLLSFATLLAFFLSSSQVARGETLEDTGLWLMLMMEGPVGSQEPGPGRFRWWLDIQPRFRDDVSGLQQGLFRPGVGYMLGERTSAWLGYARIRTTPESGTTSHENRIWQQLWWKPGSGNFAFQSRTRLEQRFLDTGSETGWRFRQFFKAGWNIPRAPRLTLVAYDEIFLDLNDTRWGQSTGFAQNRLFAGLGVKLGEQGDQGEPKLEVGYLNQFLSGSGADEMNHILSINLFLNF